MKKKMRLGRVCMDMGYVVDLDNQSMVDEARDCLYEDLMNAVKYDELGSNIKIVHDKTLKESDIPELLLEEEEIVE